MRSRLVLASSSPRRRELLGALGVPFEVMPGDVDETVPPGMALAAAAADIAGRKATAVCTACCDAVVLGADTLVVTDGPDGGVSLGKPADAREARMMLSALSGVIHTVYTGVAVATPCEGSRVVVTTDVVATRVRFRRLAGTDIDRYVESGEPFDKAGAYGIQGLAARFVERIEGDYYNVVGLPVAQVREMLRPLFPALLPAPAPPLGLPFPILPSAQPAPKGSADSPPGA